MKTTLYLIELGECENYKEYEKYIKFLSPEKQAKIQKYKFNIDKKLNLLSNLFVRYLACTVLNLNNKELKFGTNHYGKPYLIGFPDFQHNISHTRNAIAIALSENTIGVDIENIKSIDLKIAERFFCKNELNYILSRKTDQEKLFYEIWTKKEAYIKWSGEGLYLPLTSFDVTDNDIHKMLSVIEINNYMISVCNNVDFNISDVNHLTEEQMFKIFPTVLE